ncbi:MAG TPA: amidase [Acidobacteriaceae bacterium]|jgi:Asp-tRNA(Asn)/Glu-tRNA(Gln) amidotransferase A subunit family amidase|nr:amidase [Acidobacteriaceae bacterium]
MASSRREFLAKGSLSVLAAALAAGEAEASGQTAETPQASAPPGAPPVVGAGPAVGPEVSVETFVEAEKLVQVTMSAEDRAEAAGNWRESMAAVYERRTGPRKVEIGYEDAPATVWNPTLAPLDACKTAAGATVAWNSKVVNDESLPTSDEDIAFATVSELSLMIALKKITSERLTTIYMERLKRFNPKLNCVITLTEEHALAQARAADKEIAAGKYRGPLHGIPWGAKDLLDTAGIPTTWGAEFARDRVPAKDAAVTAKLNEAGAVLVAKLSLGALALNDVWFGGQTMNPWLLEEGASGSSAGPGAAVAAGLVGFAIGSETQGSIISPSMRCGVTGMRPTYGRVPRTGAMTLSWTCDKLGVMARGVEDTLLVVNAISGFDESDTASVDAPDLDLNLKGKVAGMRVGYIPAWMKETPATDVDRHALEVAKSLGMTAVPITLPDWAYDSLNIILFAESAAAFEQATLDGEVDQLKMQTPDAWPNTFRQSRFLSAVDFVQADRLRRKVAREIARVMQEVNVLLVPSLRDEQLVIFNFTGHPSLTLRAGFVEVSEARSDWAPDPKHPLPKFDPPRRVPYGVTLIGRLFDESTLADAGVALERTFRVAGERPAGF